MDTGWSSYDGGYYYDVISQCIVANQCTVGNPCMVINQYIVSDALLSTNVLCIFTNRYIVTIHYASISLCIFVNQCIVSNMVTWTEIKWLSFSFQNPSCLNFKKKFSLYSILYSHGKIIKHLKHLYCTFCG